MYGLSEKYNYTYGVNTSFRRNFFYYIKANNNVYFKWMYMPKPAMVININTNEFVKGEWLLDNTYRPIIAGTRPAGAFHADSVEQKTLYACKSLLHELNCYWQWLNEPRMLYIYDAYYTQTSVHSNTYWVLHRSAYNVKRD